MTREESIKRLEIIATNLCGQSAQNPNLWPDYKAVDMAISAIRQQEHFRDITKKVEPMTLDDAIAHLDDTLSDTGRKWSCESCRMEHVQLRAWLAELRDIKQERNAPLTLDELRKMDGEPAWFVSLHDGFASWGIVRVVEMSKVWFIAVAGAERAFGDLDGYGKTWLAYRQKPKDGDGNG